MERYKTEKVFGHIETDMTAIDTNSPEECLALQVILGAFAIEFKMFGQVENGKTIIRVFANINPEDKKQIAKDIVKMVSEKSCQGILGDRYDEMHKEQRRLFSEIKNLPNNQ